MTEPDRRSIAARLENWGRWATGSGRTIGVSPTGAFCDRLRRAALGDEPSGERRAVDDHDALRLERVMRHLDTRQRMLIWWCYIKQAPSELVCRRMGIPSSPAAEFVHQFQQAQDAVQKLLDTAQTQL